MIINGTLRLLPKSCIACLPCRGSQIQRTYVTATQDRGSVSDVDDVAVLGGGITGLASAFYLAERLPHATITLIEGSKRLGGWLRSKQIDVGNGKVVFEQGPRNLRPTRPNGWVTLDLVSTKRIVLNQQLIRMIRSKAWDWRSKC